MQISTVAVAGASGFVGRYVVRELVARGYQVRALVRDRDKARKVLPAAGSGAKVSLIVGDVLDEARVDELLRGCQACVNCIGILRENRGGSAGAQTFQRMHVDATRMLVSRSEANKVQRFVQVSALGVRDTGISEYQRSKYEAEQVLRLSSLSWTIFRPSLIHGPDGEFVQMAKGWMTGHQAPWLFIPYFTRGEEDYRVPLGGVQPVDPQVAPIAVQDVARAVGLALSNDQAIGEVYNLAGPEALSWPDMLRFMRDRVPNGNHRLEPWGIPAGFAAVQAKAAGMMGLGNLLPFDEGMARMGAEDSVASLDKVRQDLGLRPAPFRQAFAAYAASLDEH